MNVVDTERIREVTHMTAVGRTGRIRSKDNGKLLYHFCTTALGPPQYQEYFLGGKGGR